MNFKSQIIKKIKEQKEKSIYESVMETEGNWAVLKSFGFFFLFLSGLKIRGQRKVKSWRGRCRKYRTLFPGLGLDLKELGKPERDS